MSAAQFELPRFYPILDTASLGKRGLDPLDFARRLLECGARIVQFRHKGSFTGEIFEQARRIGDTVRSAGAIYVINDRVDVALMLGADAVHLGQEDLPPQAAREIAGDRLRIGFSTHNEEQLRAAENQPVDYVAFGPVFATASKENPDTTVGVRELARLRPLTDRPLVAIGGIRRARASEVFGAGADSAAVISDLFEPDAPEQWVLLG